MKHLSLLSALLISSSIVYAGWTRYEFDPATGVYKSTPEYSCLEMICEHDCVENSETGEGECCPTPVEGTNCVSDTIDEKGCILLKKTCPSNQYCNISTQTCQLIPSCNPCQKFDSDKGQCVADTTKNNQAVGACGKCDNGSIIPDTTKETDCKTCNTSNWILTNKANGIHVQDECAICQDGVSLSKENTKKVFRLQNGQCLETVVSYCSLNQEEPKDECSSCSQEKDSVVLNKSSAGTVSVKVCDGRYRVTMAGGGGGGVLAHAGARSRARWEGGGAGAYFDGVLRLKEGTYSVTIGSAGVKGNKGGIAGNGSDSTAFGITCGGGYGGGKSPGNGGILSILSSVDIIEKYKSGNGNSGKTLRDRGGISAAGGASGLGGEYGAGSRAGLVKIQYLGP